MTKTQVEVITSVQRRRRWSRAEKERIVAAAMEPGAVASEVARAVGIYTSQLFRWRQQLCERAQIPATFNAVAIAPEPATVPAPSPAWRDRDRPFRMSVWPLASQTLARTATFRHYEI
jgi:transposase